MIKGNNIPGCTCSKPVMTDPMMQNIGGYAGCPIHDPNYSSTNKLSDPVQPEAAAYENDLAFQHWDKRGDAINDTSSFSDYKDGFDVGYAAAPSAKEEGEINALKNVRNVQAEVLLQTNINYQKAVQELSEKEWEIARLKKENNELFEKAEYWHRRYLDAII